MIPSDPFPGIRQISSPVTADQLAPLDSRCRVVQFSSRLTDTDHVKLSGFLRDYPGIPLRVYGHFDIPNLLFLKHYPFLTNFFAAVYRLESCAGIEFLPDNLENFSFGPTATRKHSLNFLRRFQNLKGLFLESHTKDVGALSDLPALEQLTLRSITLPDLSVLLPLTKLWFLDIKLGGTKDLRLMPRLEKLKYLELWMIRGLEDISVIGEVTSLQNVFLQSLKNVKTLPSLRKLSSLRRLTLNTMTGITDLSPVADAPALEELIVVEAKQLDAGSLKPLVGHPALKSATIGLGSRRKDEQAKLLLNLPECRGFKSGFVYR